MSKSLYSIFEYDKLFSKDNIKKGLLMNYRERMRALREDGDFTQREIAKIINKSQQGNSHIEEGRAELRIEDLIKLCKFYRVSSDYFIGMSQKK